VINLDLGCGDYKNEKKDMFFCIYYSFCGHRKKIYGGYYKKSSIEPLHFFGVASSAVKVAFGKYYPTPLSSKKKQVL